jgi:hypothetical protein
MKELFRWLYSKSDSYRMLLTGGDTSQGEQPEIKSTFINGRLTITLPQIAPNNIPCNYAWVFKADGID